MISIRTVAIVAGVSLAQLLGTFAVRSVAAAPDEPMSPAAGSSDPASEPEPIAPAADHWAFRAPAASAVPDVKDPRWAGEPLDRFVLAALERRGLQPAPASERAVWLRRVSLDLTGLRPSAADVERFEHSTAPDAHGREVDRLLASPRYGERWGRHWLDVARYADTKGYVFTAQRRYPYSYTYRDYVVRAFNDDLPFDRFILEQLAADQLELKESTAGLAAMGFLTLGRRFLNNVHDIIDDRIDVVTRGLLGLTVSCARCHDHKYDPVPTADYYSLYGVFASSREPKELPLLGTPEETTAFVDYQEKRQAILSEIEAFKSSAHADLQDELRRTVGLYLTQIAATRDAARDPRPNSNLAKGEPRGQFLPRWRAYLQKTARAKHPVFAAWHALRDIPDADFSAKVAGTLEALAKLSPEASNPRVLAALHSPPLSSFKEVGGRYGELFEESYRRFRELQGTDPKKDRLEDPHEEALRQVLFEKSGPLDFAVKDVSKLIARKRRAKLRELKKKLDTHDATSPGAPPRAMTLEDLPSPVNPYVFLRGAAARRGPSVPRQFLAALSPKERAPFERGSGRLELANAIASADNPLTARVFVNRVWMHHFGEGFVRTPSDFGRRADPPSHPELLDTLAAEFTEGWSVKDLQRRIVLSSTYRQAADVASQSLFERQHLADPDNRLLWHYPRRRLDFEAMRDTILAAAGELDLAVGGPSVPIHRPPFSRRRTIYALIERQNLPALFRTFDFASPDTTCPQRFETTVPQQALFLLNSEWLAEQAKRLAQRAELSAAPTLEDKVTACYRLLLQREPLDDERRYALEFLRSTSNDAEAEVRWEQFAQVLLMSNEFSFIE